MFYPKVNTSPKWVFPNTLCVYLSPNYPLIFFDPVQLAKGYLMVIEKVRRQMLYIIFALAVLISGFVSIICCMFSSMLSREEEHNMKVHESTSPYLLRI